MNKDPSVTGCPPVQITSLIVVFFRFQFTVPQKGNHANFSFEEVKPERYTDIMHEFLGHLVEDETNNGWFQRGYLLFSMLQEPTLAAVWAPMCVQP